MLTPDEALDWGLVSQVVEEDQLVPAAVEFAAGVAKKSPLAVRNAEQVLNAAWWEGTGVSAAFDWSAR